MAFFAKSRQLVGDSPGAVAIKAQGRGAARVSGGLYSVGAAQSMSASLGKQPECCVAAN
jgi:hypothetical protein